MNVILNHVRCGHLRLIDEGIRRVDHCHRRRNLLRLTRCHDDAKTRRGEDCVEDASSREHEHQHADLHAFPRAQNAAVRFQRGDAVDEATFVAKGKMKGAGHL